uniref:Uncharacterized protein n=1 Tax=Panagrolaimus superbus TaxID=310955 RepID=A0A914Y8X7_9BILA
MGHNFSQYNHENPIVRDTLFSFGLTEVHLECLSRWFDCRIGVYDEKNWKRYGNWDDGNSDAATFLITMQDGKFMPIFDFN